MTSISNNMTDLQKIEYIHFVLQEAQNYYMEENEDYNSDIENAIYLLEELREPYFTDDSDYSTPVSN